MAVFLKFRSVSRTDLIFFEISLLPACLGGLVVQTLELGMPLLIIFVVILLIHRPCHRLLRLLLLLFAVLFDNTESPATEEVGLDN